MYNVTRAIATNRKLYVGQLASVEWGVECERVCVCVCVCGGGSTSVANVIFSKHVLRMVPLRLLEGCYVHCRKSVIFQARQSRVTYVR